MSTVQATTSTTADIVAQKLKDAVAASQVPTPASTGGDSASGASAIGSSSSQEDRFLKLLVALMRNQDPLNPLDNAQVTSQMAQISTVTGIEKLNQAMTKLASASAPMSSPLDAVGAIGHKVLSEGSTFQRVAATDGPVQAGFELAAPADSVKVEIVDATGQPVWTKNFGKAAAGLQVFQWDAGSAPAGSYQLRVTATANGKAVSATPLTTAPVIGITQDSDGVQLQVSGRAPVPARDVKAIL